MTNDNQTTLLLAARAARVLGASRGAGTEGGSHSAAADPAVERCFEQRCGQPPIGRPAGRRAARVLAALAAATGVLNAGRAEAVQLDPALPELVAQAARQGRPVFVAVGRERCGSCRRHLNRLDLALLEPAGRATVVLYDADQGYGPDVVERYNIVVFPTVLRLSSSGDELARATAPESTAALVRSLQAVDDTRPTHETLLESVRQCPADLTLRLELGQLAALRGDEQLALEQLDAVVAADPDNRRNLAARALLAKGYWLMLLSFDQAAEAAKTLTELRRRFSGSDAAREAAVALARALHRLGNTQAARRLLEQAIRVSGQPGLAADFALAEQTGEAWALPHATAAVEAAPRDPLRLEQLARLAEAQAQTAAAARAWQAAFASGRERYADQQAQRLRRQLAREPTRRGRLGR